MDPKTGKNKVFAVLYRDSPQLRLSLDRCYLKLMTPEIGLIFDLHRAWRHRGIPPMEGGYLDQPQILLEAFDLIDFYTADALEHT